MTLRIFATAVTLLACACGTERAQEPVDAAAADALANRIEAVAELEEKEPPPPPRLAALAPADIPPAFLAGPSCRLQQGDRLLLIATSKGAVVRADGRVMQLRVAAPAGPSGGFFEADGVTVSIGRRAEAAADPGASVAGATVGGDPRRSIERITARWSCSR